MGGKGASQGSNYQNTAGTNAYNAAKSGQSWDQISANQPNYLEASKAGFDQFNSENQWNSMLSSMLAPQGAQTDPYAEQRAAATKASEDAAKAAQTQELISKRDGYINSYFDAANHATSFVTDKIASEKANAALMGVDYNMTDEIKSDRISNYFSTLWSEGNQTALDKSFKDIGSGGFKQSVFRGAGVEAGPAGSVGEEKSGGSLVPKPKSLIDPDQELGTETVTALGV